MEIPAIASTGVAPSESTRNSRDALLLALADRRLAVVGPNPSSRQPEAATQVSAHHPLTSRNPAASMDPPGATQAPAMMNVVFSNDGADEISALARLLSQLHVPEPSDKATAGSRYSTSANADRSPLLPSAPSANTPAANERSGASELAGALSRDIATSGRFYESHLARWVNNDYPLAQLSLEPQFRETMDGTSDVGARNAGHQPPVIADSLLPMVRQQLTMLESSTVTWSGALWPGQQATIQLGPEIDPDAGRAHASTDSTANRAWFAQIAIECPTLGWIDARITLQRAGARILVLTPDSVVHERLAATGDALARSLEARGITQSSVTVQAAPAGHPTPAAS